MSDQITTIVEECVVQWHQHGQRFRRHRGRFCHQRLGFRQRSVAVHLGCRSKLDRDQPFGRRGLHHADHGGFDGRYSFGCYRHREYRSCRPCRAARRSSPFRRTLYPELSDTLTTGIGNLVDANMAQESALLTVLADQAAARHPSLVDRQPGALHSALAVPVRNSAVEPSGSAAVFRKGGSRLVRLPSRGVGFSWGGFVKKEARAAAKASARSPI